MEAGQKTRRGFLKSKLAMSLCRVAKPAAKPSQPGPVGFYNNGHAAVTSQKVYAARREATVEGLVHGGGDENVDARAAGYIMHVRERFKLEGLDYERRRYQEVSY